MTTVLGYVFFLSEFQPFIKVRPRLLLLVIIKSRLVVYCMYTLYNHLMNDSDYLAQALVLAKQASIQGEVPVGAIVVYKDSVIAQAYNLKEARKDAMAHAELLVLQKAQEVLGDWRLTGCTVYVTLEPCPMCCGALLHTRVDRLVYGAKDPKWGACGSVVDLSTESLFNHSLKRTYLPMLKCGDVLSDFFKQRRSLS